MDTPNGDRDVNDPDDFNDLRSSYTALLARASGRVPDDRVDWDAFYRTLAARAELSLARLRYPHVAVTTADDAAPAVRTLSLPSVHPWWEYAARWSRLIVTGSIAAGIALIAVVRMSPKDVSDTLVATTVTATSEATEGARAAFESAATGRKTASWTIESALMPSATDLLIPLGKGVPAQ